MNSIARTPSQMIMKNDDGVTLRLMKGKMEDRLKELEDNSVDSIVTDPPYHMSSIVKRFGPGQKGVKHKDGAAGAYSRASKGFMGKEWDGGDIAFRPETWEECLRVLKPGGYLLSFSSARTYHRMAVAIEDAGFEIRDQIMWVYGSGFPKSHNLGKAHDKKFGIERKDMGPNPNNRPNPDNVANATHDYGITSKSANITKGDGPLEGWGTALKPAHEPIVVAAKPNEEWNDLGRNHGRCPQCGKHNSHGQIPGGKCDDEECYVRAQLRHRPDNQFAGWGTALKPAHEPIVLARKPISEKTVLANSLKWGVGGVNIDASRVPYSDDNPMPEMTGGITTLPMGWEHQDKNNDAVKPGNDEGRFPANLIHDGSQQVLDLFPEVNKGSAARFFYVPKVGKKDRNEGLEHLPDQEFVNTIAQPERDRRPFHPQKNTHPTVKPTDLMHYLIRMITPTGGVVLDPFMGSGSTGKAAVRHGFDFIGIEMEQSSYDVALARIEHEM